jgi:hypothetical protein
MSRTKRTPIDYKPQFGEGIFRPKDVVDSELDTLQTHEPDATAEAPNASMRARTRARSSSRAPSRGDAALADDLARTLQQKQRLASSTFRFQPQELEELDEVTAQIARATGAKLSKNDVVRLALNWLLADYKENGERSMLGRVLQRT